jgi:hypothetical protein
MNEGGRPHGPAAWHSVKNPGTIWIGGWEGPSSGLDCSQKRKMSCLCWHLNPRSLSPYLVTTPTVLSRFLNGISRQILYLTVLYALTVTMQRSICTSVLGACENCEKGPLASSCTYVLPSAQMELGSQWTDFNKIWYLRIFTNSVEKIRVLLKSDKE